MKGVGWRGITGNRGDCFLEIENKFCGFQKTSYLCHPERVKTGDRLPHSGIDYIGRSAKRGRISSLRIYDHVAQQDPFKGG